MGVDHLLRGTAVGGLIGFVACGPRGEFACDDDSACVDGSRVGRCEANGYCSFPDRHCASGYRYGQHAATGVAGACVDPGTTTGSSTGGVTVASSATQDGTGGVTSTTGGGGTIGLDATGTPTGSATTLATTVAGTGSTVTSAGTTGSTGAATGTGGQSTCVDDHFDDGVIATFGCEFDATGITLGEAGGTFQCTMDSSGNGAYAGINSCDYTDLTGVVAHVELVTPPDAATTAVALIEIRNDNVGFGLAVSSGQIYAYNFDSSGAYTDYGFAAYDPVAHRWLQARDLGNQQVRLEASPDGTQWAEIATVSDFGAVPYGHIAITCGYQQPPSSVVPVVWDNFEYCQP